MVSIYTYKEIYKIWFEILAKKLLFSLTLDSSNVQYITALNLFLENNFYAVYSDHSCPSYFLPDPPLPPTPNLLSFPLSLENKQANKQARIKQSRQREQSTINTTCTHTHTIKHKIENHNRYAKGKAKKMLQESIMRQKISSHSIVCFVAHLPLGRRPPVVHA